MIISETKLRRLIREILIEAMSRRSFLKGLGAAGLALSSLPSSADANTKINDLFDLKKKVADKIKQKGGNDADNQLAALNGVFNELMSKADENLSSEDIMRICMNNNLDGKYFGIIDRGINSSSSSSGSSASGSFPHRIVNPKVEVKVKDDYYYLIYKGMKTSSGNNFYYKAPKSHFDNYMAEGSDALHGMSDRLRNDSLDGKSLEKQIRDYLRLMTKTDIEDAEVRTFRHIIEDTFLQMSPEYYDTKITFKPKYQAKVKNIFNSIK